MLDLDATSLHWTPNRWVVVLLCLFMPPLAFMYLGKKYWAWIYLLLVLLSIGLRLLWLPQVVNDDLAWLHIPVPLLALFHAYPLAKRIEGQRRWYSRWYGLLGVWVLFTIPFLLMRVFVYDHFRIPASSMLPTLVVGQIIHVNKWGCGNYRYLNVSFLQTKPTNACPIKHGDLVVFDYPPDPNYQYIKRVMAVGGDHILIENKKVWLNGKLMAAEWMDEQEHHEYWQETLGEHVYQVKHLIGQDRPVKFNDLTVPEGHLFVMGDNRDHSLDSRLFGLVPVENVVGVVF